MNDHFLTIGFSETIQAALRFGLNCTPIHEESLDDNELSDAFVGGTALFAWQDEAGSCERRVKRIRSACGFKKIFLVVCCPDERDENIERALQCGADYVLTRYLEDLERTLESIRRISGETLSLRPDDIPFAKAFIESVSDVISVMAGMDASVRDVYVTHGQYFLGDVSGLMKLSGISEGYIAVNFREATARKIIAGLLGQRTEDLSSSDIDDGVYEALNMIAGGAKAKLAGTSHYFELSTPVVIRDSDCKRLGIAGARSLRITFDLSEGGPFAVQICIAQKKDDTGPAI